MSRKALPREYKVSNLHLRVRNFDEKKDADEVFRLFQESMQNSAGIYLKVMFCYRFLSKICVRIQGFSH